MAGFQRKEQDLFFEIARDIKTSPEKYREAGKQLDKFYSKDEYWANREIELTCCKAYLNPEAPLHKEWGQEFLKHQKERKKELELLLKVKDNSPLALRLRDVWEFLEVNYTLTSSLGDNEAKTILLIVWLLTDPDADKANLNLTQFENWPWGLELGQITEEFSQIRGILAKSWWLNSKRNWGLHKKYPELWKNIIHHAWTMLKAEKELVPKMPEEPAATEQGNKTNKKPPKSKLAQKLIEVIDRVVELAKEVYSCEDKFAYNTEIEQLCGEINALAVECGLANEADLPCSSGMFSWRPSLVMRQASVVMGGFEKAFPEIGQLYTLRAKAKLLAESESQESEEPAETEQDADKIIGNKFNLWGLEIHWRVLWNTLKKPMTNLKTFLRRDK